MTTIKLKNQNEVIYPPPITELPSGMKTIKVEVRVWDSLKSKRGENETFNDVIKELLMQRTQSVGNDNVKAIKYKQKTVFFTSYDFSEKIGYEFEYNDVKNQKNDFTLDLKIKKVYYGRKVLSPSQFFGTDTTHKHFSNFYLYIYFKAIALALHKEFRVHFPEDTLIIVKPRHYDSCNYFNSALWRKTYYEYNLSEESFIEDIEEHLRLSEEETPSSSWEKRVEESIANKIERKYKK